jgi:hypothetical protein
MCAWKYPDLNAYLDADPPPVVVAEVCRPEVDITAATVLPRVGAPLREPSRSAPHATIARATAADLSRPSWGLGGFV